MKKLLLILTLMSVSLLVAQTWTTQNTGFADPSQGVSDIHIFSANDVWARGYDGSGSGIVNQTLIKTTNGGTTWTPTLIDITHADYSINNLIALDMNTAWLSATDVTTSPTAGPFPGGIWKTIDGGATWNEQVTGIYDPTGLDNSFIDWVHFFDANNGVVVGDPINTTDFQLAITNDGGTTWSQIPANLLPNIIAGEAGLNGSNTGAGNSFWFCTNKGKLYHTADKGATWDKKNTPIPAFGAAATGGDIFFKDDNVGCLVGRTTTGTGATAVNTYKIYTTTNGGTTWSTGVTTIYNQIAYVPGTNIMVGTSRSSGSGYSSNNGTTWTALDTATQRVEVKFFDANTGWAAGFNSATDPALGGIFKFTGTQLFTSTFSNDNAFKASPNPTTGVVALTGKNIANVIVTDVLGKQVSNTNFTSLSTINLDLTAAKGGVYMVKVTNNEGNVSTLKVVKQ